MKVADQSKNCTAYPDVSICHINFITDDILTALYILILVQEGGIFSKAFYCPIIFPTISVTLSSELSKMYVFKH